MAWLSVSSRHIEYITDFQPVREMEAIMIVEGEEDDYHGHFMPKEVPSGSYRCIWDYESLCGRRGIMLPKGSIKKLIGRELTWEDEPVELKKEHR